MLDPQRHTFETLWGHDSAKRCVLRFLTEGRMPHALLLEGRDAIGKRSFALAAAKVILSAGRQLREAQFTAPAPPRMARPSGPPSPEPPDDEPDLFGGGFDEAPPAPPPGEPEPDLFADLEPTAPPSSPKPPAAEPVAETRRPIPFLGLDADTCRRVEAAYPPKFDSDGRAVTLGHPDLVVVEPSGNSRSVLVGQIDALHQIAALPPIVGAFRLVIVLGIDTITQVAANSMLKLLEEPASYLRFILVTDHAHRVMPTIRSRCTRIPLFPLPFAELCSLLREREQLAPELAAVAAAFAEGRPGIALRLAGSDLLRRRADVFEARLTVERVGWPALAAAAHRALQAGGKYDETVRLLLAFARDRMVRRCAPRHPELLVNGDLDSLLAAGSATLPDLDEESERLFEALLAADHPFLPASQTTLESALFPAD